MSKANTGKTVRFTLDERASLSAEQLQQVERLKHRKIDFSDIPPSPPGAEWVRPASVETKQSVTLRLDRDVLEFFRQAGKRYQTRINQVLRAYMHAHDGKS